MRLQLRCHSDIDLSQPGMQVEIRSHIARCLRNYPNDGEGVITLAGVEYCFMYVVQNDVVDTVMDLPTTSSRSSTSVGKTCMKRRPRSPARIAPTRRGP
jgi:hypothetical protein